VTRVNNSVLQQVERVARIDERAPMLSELTSPEQDLIRLLQKISFGRIENIEVVDGQPCFGPTVRVVRSVAVSSKPGAIARPDDFVLKRQVQDLIAEIRNSGTATIYRIDVRFGLPVRLELATELSEGARVS
jgi:hypothetical protein